MYCLEFAGEDDPFAALEAAAAGGGIELLGPGLGAAATIDTERIRTLAYTRRACELLGRTDATVESARVLLETAPIERTGSVAVRATDVRSTADVDTRRVERELGDVLVDRGFAVDLEEPDHELRAYFARGPIARDPAAEPEDALNPIAAGAVRLVDEAGDGRSTADAPEADTDGQKNVEHGDDNPTTDRTRGREEPDVSGDERPERRPTSSSNTGGQPPQDVARQYDLCVLGWTVAESRRDFGERAPTDRPFFQPGSMDPLLARALVNVAGAGPGRTVFDPMCGTGGLLAEASLVGARAIGLDAQAKMAAGARENLQSIAPESSWAVLRGDAARPPLAGDAVDTIVFDVPYERQSAVAGRELDDLVADALAACRSLSPRAVLVADRPWIEPARAARWTVRTLLRRRVHGSLVRHVHVLEDGNDSY